MNTKLKLFLLLFFLGLLGILSLLTIQIPMDSIPTEIAERFSPNELKMLTLINPMVLLIIALIIGILLFDKVNLQLPLLFPENDIEQSEKSFAETIKYGLFGGALSGSLIVCTGLLFQPYLPTEFNEASQKIELSIFARLLYGGITEELLLRFGVMTLAVWIVSKMTKALSPAVYWSGILISSLLFALGHFPIVFQTVESPSSILLSYILLGNSVGGLIFGWLYWKQGLEAAIIAHMATHIVMMLGESLFTL
ncbi:MAG: lysostaphin resistance A-like protein [Calditrichia bacterium]